MIQHQIMALIAIAELGSFRAAAQWLNLSQTALTKAINTLEDDYGIEVLTRTARGAQLTEAGKLLYGHALAIVAEEQRAQADVARIKGESSGEVSVALSPLCLATLLGSAYRAFREQVPGARVEFTEFTQPGSLARLREGLHDFVVVGTFDADPAHEFDSIDLLTDAGAVACRRDHPLCRAGSMTELRDADWIVYAVSRSHRDVIVQTLGQEGIHRPDRFASCSSLTLILPLIVETDAISLLPWRLIGARWCDGVLMRMPIADPMPLLTLRLYSRRGSRRSAPAQQLIECFCEVARSYQGPPAQRGPS